MRLLISNMRKYYFLPHYSNSSYFLPPSLLQQSMKIERRYKPFNLSQIKISHLNLPPLKGSEKLDEQQRKRQEWEKILDRLVEDKNFQYILNPKVSHAGTYIKCPRRNDRELILQMIAWSPRKYRSYGGSIDNFSKKEMNFCRSEKEMKELESKFKKIMKFVRNIFSETDQSFGAFRSWSVKSQKWSKDVKKALWIPIYLAFCDLLNDHPTEPVFAKSKSQLQSAIKRLFESKTLDLRGPLTAKIFERRRDIIHKACLSVLNEHSLQKKAYSRNSKNDRGHIHDLYDEQGGKCKICESTIDRNRIHEGDYAQIDHIKPIIKGGSSVKGNLALVHATCNQSKGARTSANVN